MVKASDDLDAAYCLGPGEHKPAKGVLNITETSSTVERKVDGIEKKDLDTTLASLSTSLNDESDSMHTGSAMRDTSSGASMHFQPMVFKNSASIFTQCGDSSNRDSQKFRVGNASDQYRVFSAKEKLFALQTAVSQYRPRNSGGSMIKSVAPGTKP
jgi:hypothetical protein